MSERNTSASWQKDNGIRIDHVLCRHKRRIGSPAVPSNGTLRMKSPPTAFLLSANFSVDPDLRRNFSSARAYCVTAVFREKRLKGASCVDPEPVGERVPSTATPADRFIHLHRSYQMKAINLLVAIAMATTLVACNQNTAPPPPPPPAETPPTPEPPPPAP